MPDTDLYVITGASAGLGYQAALKLARSGAAIVLTGRRQAELEAAASAAAAAGSPEALALRLDLSDLADVKRFADDLAAKLPGRKVRSKRARLQLRVARRAPLLAGPKKQAQRHAWHSGNPCRHAPQIKGLVLNAGINTQRFAWSKDGLESTWATNHLGHFYLAQL